MNKHKQIATTALLLMLFAIGGASLVGLIHDNTIERIQRNEEEVLLRKLNTILDSGSYDNSLLDDRIRLEADPLLGTREPSVAYRAYRNGKPTAVVLSPVAPDGYNGPIHLLVGINDDGSLAGVRVVRHRETPGLGDAIESDRSDWILGFGGQSLKSHTRKQWRVKRDGGAFDQFTGATITPRAVVKAVYSALLYFDKHHRALLPLRQPGHGKPDTGGPDDNAT